MKINYQEINCQGIKLSIIKNSEEIARAYLYIMKNDLHKEPFGLLEDVFVSESERGLGIGSKLVNEIIKQSKNKKCYKIIATSRYSRSKVHKLYERLGFKNYGVEFRMNLKY